MIAAIHTRRAIRPMLEDDFTYVLRKALRGLFLSPEEAAARAGIPSQDVLAFLRGSFSASTALALAPVLGLDAAAFSTHADYNPAPRNHPFLHRLILPFGDEHVNAWLISAGGTGLLFDTGDDKTSCLAKLRELGRTALTAAFTTHGHPDHIGGNEILPRIAGASFGPGGIPFTRSIKPGETFRFGPLSVEAFDLSGHFTPALGYLVKDLPSPLFVPGDAIFAGSIGGCDPSTYHDAIARIRLATDHLPDETILLPGHGPATTLGEERLRNPFLASTAK